MVLALGLDADEGFRAQRFIVMGNRLLGMLPILSPFKLGTSQQGFIAVHDGLPEFEEAGPVRPLLAVHVGIIAPTTAYGEGRLSGGLQSFRLELVQVID